jgi:hypothetical protein
MCPYQPISDQVCGGEGRYGGRKTETLDTYGNPDSQFPQEIRQCLDMILSETPRMTKINGPITASSTVFLRV